MAQTKAEETLTTKIESEFARALGGYPDFNIWRFVTNVPVGPMATKALIELKSKHDKDATRPMAVRHGSVARLWYEVVSKLPMESLNPSSQVCRVWPTWN